jgi:nicotinate-nucleotide pyrophosphorylase (carboxylating)
VQLGDVVFHASGSSQSILKAERMVLNSCNECQLLLQNEHYVQILKGTGTKYWTPERPRPVFGLPKNSKK